MPKTPKTFTDALENLFRLRVNSMIAVKRAYDDWALKQIWRDRVRRIEVRQQKIDLVAHQAYGSDLAVSRFVLMKCKGKVRNQNGTWISNIKQLPSEYDKSFAVTSIDASNGGLIPEGIDNFVGLNKLQSLDLSYNPKLDDFACDQLARQFRKSKTLGEINLSFNPVISVYGLDVLFRIPSIRTINAAGTYASKHEQINLFTLAAEDERNCIIQV